MNIGQKIKDFEIQILDLNNQIKDLKEKLNLSKPSVLPKIENEEYDKIVDLKYLHPYSLIMILRFKNISTKTPSFYIIKGEIQTNVYEEINNIYFLNETFTKIPLIGEDNELITDLVLEVSPSNLIYIIPENANKFLKKKINELILEIKYEEDKKSFSIENKYRIDRVNFSIKDVIFDNSEKYIYTLEVLDPRIEKDLDDNIQTNKCVINCYNILKKSQEFKLINTIVLPKLDIDWKSFLGWMNQNTIMIINDKKLNLEKVNHYGVPIELKKEEKEEVDFIKNTYAIQNNKDLNEMPDRNYQIIKYISLNAGYSNKDNSFYRVINLIPNGSLSIRLNYSINKIFFIPEHFGKKNFINLNNIFEPYGLIYTNDIKTIINPINEKELNIKEFEKNEDCKEIPVYFQKLNQ